MDIRDYISWIVIIMGGGFIAWYFIMRFIIWLKNTVWEEAQSTFLDILQEIEDLGDVAKVKKQHEAYLKWIEENKKRKAIK